MNGKYLKNWRKSLGLTQTETAKILGYANHTRICQIENGKGRIPKTTLLLMDRIKGDQK